MTFDSASSYHIVTPSPFIPAAKTPKRVTRHCDRQKREKAELKHQLIELQRLLLESKRPRRLEVCRVGHSTRKALINRQLNRRLASDATQLWLKTAIAGKATLISDLITLIEQQLRTASWITVQSNGLYDSVFLQPTDELLYAMYNHELDQVYAQTDAVFSSCGIDLNEETSSFQHTPLTMNGDTVSMQFWWKQLFPFAFNLTCDCMWMIAHLLNRQEEREDCKEVGDSKTTIAAKFRVSNGRNEALHHRFVQRRFMENERQISVWKSSMRGDGVYRGMQMEETGWCVFQPSTSGEGTFVFVWVHQVPLHVRSAQEVSQPAATRFNDFVQGIVRENSEEATKMAKTLLLERALDGIHV